MFVLAYAAVAATAPGTAPVYHFDMTCLHELDRSDPAQAREAWDTAHLVASVQGIVNRERPVLFVRFMPHPDDFWFDYLRGEGQWLAGRDVVRLDSVEDLLRTFEPKLKGVVVYDERVWATSNLASTIAGVEDRVCLRYGPSQRSVYGRVMGSGLGFTQDARRLLNEDGSPMFTGQGVIPGTDVASTGSAKCDAYLWAQHHYLDAGRCSRDYLAFYIDAYWLTHPLESGFSNATLTNHDFFIAQRAFFFDLHVWEEEAPVDDPDQKPGTDVATLRAILRSMYEQSGGRIVHIGGFTPWAWKYTNHGKAGSAHGPVDTEWKYAQIISAYNGVMDADALGCAGMANASFYQHYPLEARYPQNPRPTAADLEQRGLIRADGTVAPRVYVCFYMGDYDSAAWFNYHVPKWWRDPAHGETLCTWAFNPNLDRRAPHAMDYVRRHQSANDWFMFGDSGAGYLNPGMLVAPRPDSGLPDGLEAWVAHNLPYARRYDLSITGFIIDGHSPAMGEKGMDAYQRFSPDGIVGQKVPAQGVHRAVMPYTRMKLDPSRPPLPTAASAVMPYTRMKLDLYGSPEEAGARIAGLAGVNAPKFLFIRTILQSPSWHKGAMEAASAAEPSVTFLDPYSFFLLLKTHVLSESPGVSAIPSRSEVSFIAPDRADGLAPVRVSDGPFEIKEMAGKPALYQPKHESTRYLYFEVADALAQQVQQDRNRTVRVVATLLDRTPGEVGIQYDSHRGSAYRDGPRHQLTGTGEWTELVFDLPEPCFAHGQNGGADFRFVNFGTDLCMHRVTAEVLDLEAAPERIKAFCVDFNWGASGFAPPGMYAQASAKAHFEWYRALGVNTIQTFCVSCPGYAWYQSDVAPVQPGMKGSFLKELTELGHAAGMRVMGYFCVGANTHWSETHPELSHDLPSSIAIPFTTEYLDYLAASIQDALTKTDIDGFMIDWVFNASHHYPDKEYSWLECEKRMYPELFDQPFPGDAAMTRDRIDAFNRRATERCWDRIRDAAKSVKPDCIIWLSCYDLQHPTVAGSKMLEEVDWLMNEHPDPAKLDAARRAAGPHTQLMQCICGWGDQHDAARILDDPRFADVGMYGFARPDPETTLPPEDGSGNARNIAAMRAAFQAP